MKRCVNGCLEAHPPQLPVRRRQAVRPHLAKTKVILVKAEAEERDVVGEETIVKRGILRWSQASLDISTIHSFKPKQMHPQDKEVDVSSLREMGMTF